MTFVERDQKVQALPTNRADQSLTVGIRLGRPDWRLQHAQAKALQLRIQVGREYRISVMDEEPIRMVICQTLAELLQRPFRCGMRCHVGVENPPRADLHGHETYSTRIDTVTETMKSQATMPLAWLHKGRPALICRSSPGGRNLSRYLPTVA